MTCNPSHALCAANHRPRSSTGKVPYRLDLFGEKADFRLAAAEFVVRTLRPNNRNI
jgi:hypothetical protein